MSVLSSSSSDERSFSGRSDNFTDQDWTTLEQESHSGESESESGVCVAVPPSVSTSYNEVVLTGSTALDILDQVGTPTCATPPFYMPCPFFSSAQLLANNEIGKERAARLRRKYNELRDNLNT